MKKNSKDKTFVVSGTKWRMTPRELQTLENDYSVRRITKKEALRVLAGGKVFINHWGHPLGGKRYPGTEFVVKHNSNGNIRIGCMLFRKPIVQLVKRWASR